MFSELACDFEVDFCFWQTQTQSWAHPWLPFSGPTPTAFTGPDAAFDGNWYVYAETDLLGSDSSIQPEFILTSHIFTASSAARYLHFSYHMSGYDIQTLWLASWSLEDGNGWLQTQLWSRQGPQGSSWGIALVSVPPNAIVLEFVTDMRYLSLGQYGIWRSDIALDAIGTGVPTVDFNQLSCNFEFDVLVAQHRQFDMAACEIGWGRLVARSRKHVRDPAFHPGDVGSIQHHGGEGPDLRLSALWLKLGLIESGAEDDRNRVAELVHRVGWP